MNEIGIYTDRKVYSIPNGLNELIYDISKEVLRVQPKNIYQFISQYLITLLKVREAVKVAVPLIEEDFTSADDQVDFLKRYNLTRDQGNKFAVIIQAAFRGYRTRKKLMNFADEYVREEARSYQSKVESVFEEEVDYEDPIFKYLKTRGISKEKTIEAATKIQAYFRGYKVRKLEKSKGLECLVRDIPSHESWRHDWLNEPILSKRTTIDDLPWRKSFIDFHKNFIKRHEGDRLHMETIFGGKYEDYNLMCEYSSCQELEIPTVMQAKELVRPGDIVSSSSEGLSIPVDDEIKEMLLKEGAGELLIFEQDETEKKSLTSGTLFFQEKPELEPEIVKTPKEALPVREKSITQLRESRNTERTPSAAKLIGSKSRFSKPSMSHEKSAPELLVRSLSHTHTFEDETRSMLSVHLDMDEEKSEESLSGLSAEEEKGKPRSSRSSAKSIEEEKEEREELKTSARSASGSKASASKVSALKVSASKASASKEESVSFEEGTSASSIMKKSFVSGGTERVSIKESKKSIVIEVEKSPSASKKSGEESLTRVSDD